MRSIANILCGLMVVIGTLWFLEGAHILPGAGVMSADTSLIWRGASTAAVGVLILVVIKLFLFVIRKQR